MIAATNTIKGERGSAGHIYDVDGRTRGKEGEGWVMGYLSVAATFTVAHVNEKKLEGLMREARGADKKSD